MGLPPLFFPFQKEEKKHKKQSSFRLIASGWGELCHIINIYKYMYKYTFISMREDKRNTTL